MGKQHTVYAQQYINEAIGSKLGWLEISVNPFIITSFIVLLILATISEKNTLEFKWKSKIWLLLIILAISLLINVAMYVSWTPVGANIVNGVQGRYFTPILILALLCLVKKDTNWKVNNLNTKAMTITFLLSALTIVQVIASYI